MKQNIRFVVWISNVLHRKWNSSRRIIKIRKQQQQQKLQKQHHHQCKIVFIFIFILLPNDIDWKTEVYDANWNQLFGLFFSLLVPKKNPKSQIIVDELSVCFLFRMTWAKTKQRKIKWKEASEHIAWTRKREKQGRRERKNRMWMKKLYKN